MKIIKRPRRLRTNENMRRLVAENKLSAHDFIWPLFIHQGPGTIDIDAMSGVQRLDETAVLKACEQALKAQIPAVAIFPAVVPELCDETGSEAYNDDGIVQQMTRSIKRNFPELLVIVDVALDPYTSHGHDGLLTKEGIIQNDETVEALVKQALSLANSKADILAPSDMMDGRVKQIRLALEENNFIDTKIMSYAAKYASCFYGPFRNAIGSGDRLKGDKRSYQMNPANIKEGIEEIRLDIEEGADMVMVKPGMAYLDVIKEAANTFATPLFAYQVSGEFAMISAAAERGWLNREDAILESLMSFKRAGCAGTLSYFALEAATLLNK